VRRSLDNRYITFIQAAQTVKTKEQVSISQGMVITGRDIAGADSNKIFAELVELASNFVFGTLTNTDNHNNSHDTNDHAKHSQDAPPFSSSYVGHRHSKVASA
jgi:hypothetical protein